MEVFLEDIAYTQNAFPSPKDCDEKSVRQEYNSLKKLVAKTAKIRKERNKAKQWKIDKDRASAWFWKIDKGEPITGEDLARADMTFAIQNYRVAPYTERFVQRLAFNGCIHRSSGRISDFYREKRNNPTGRLPSKAQRKSYHLKAHPFMKAMLKHDSLSPYLGKMVEIMAVRGISPKDMSSLTLDDCKDLLIDAVVARNGSEAESARQTRSIYIPGGYRQKTVEQWGKKHGHAFKKAFIADGATAKEAAEYVKQMKKGYVPKQYDVHHISPIAGHDGDGAPDITSPQNFVMIKKEPYHAMLHDFLERQDGQQELHIKANRNSEQRQEDSKWFIIPRPKPGVIFYAGPNKSLQVTTRQPDRLNNLLQASKKKRQR